MNFRICRILKKEIKEGLLDNSKLQRECHTWLSSSISISLSISMSSITSIYITENYE